MKIESFLALALVMLGSCSRFDEEAIDYDNSSCVSIAIEGEGITRGSLAQEVSEMESVAIYAGCSGAKAWSEEAQVNMMDETRFDYSEQQMGWVIDGEAVAWDSGRQSLYTFFGYSPYATNKNGIETYMEAGEMVIEYEMPTKCSRQPDLMIARPMKDIYKPSSGVVEMEFYHALSALKFSVQGDGRRAITDITIGGICDRGTLTWDYELDTLSWGGVEMSGESLSFSAKIDGDLIASTEELVASSLDGYLMVIPQRLPDEGIEVTIGYESDDEQGSMGLIIAPTEWVAGKVYTYVIDLSEEDGATITQSANCYMLHPQDNVSCYYIPVDSRNNAFWDGALYGDNSLNVISVDCDGAVAGGDNVRAAVILYDYVDENGLGDDISNSGFEVEIVTSGFSSQGVTLKQLAEGLGDFTDVGCEVAMRVKLGNILNGNIVVAAYRDVDCSGSLELTNSTCEGEGDLVLWSWHLWITDYNPDAIAYANRNYIVPEEIKAYCGGGSDGALHRYIDRDDTYGSPWSSSGIYADKFIMDRNLGAISADGYGHGDGTNYSTGLVQYQFGRKDPFVGESGHYLDSDGVFASMSIPMLSGEQVSRATSIHTPTTLYTQYFNWCSEGYQFTKSLWYDEYVSSAINGENYGAKSFFDPSPLGWRLPVDGTWSDFEDDCTPNKAIWDSSSIYGYGRFYPNYNASIDHDISFCYYPANGTRNVSSSRCVYGKSRGYIWSATPYDYLMAYHYYYTSGLSEISRADYIYTCRSVRSVQE